MSVYIAYLDIQIDIALLLAAILRMTMKKSCKTLSLRLVIMDISTTTKASSQNMM